jgi:hypothetical protein
LILTRPRTWRTTAAARRETTRSLAAMVRTAGVACRCRPMGARLGTAGQALARWCPALQHAALPEPVSEAFASGTIDSCPPAVVICLSAAEDDEFGDRDLEAPGPGPSSRGAGPAAAAAAAGRSDDDEEPAAAAGGRGGRRKGVAAAPAAAPAAAAVAAKGGRAAPKRRRSRCASAAPSAVVAAACARCLVCMLLLLLLLFLLPPYDATAST